jgi:alpha-1,2-glucosyltransferase
MWRLLVPAWYLPAGAEGSIDQAASKSNNELVKNVLSYARQTDVRLLLETAWFLIVNLVTISIFLLKPYQWRAEDGTLLDEGRLQRFMW